MSRRRSAERRPVAQPEPWSSGGRALGQTSHGGSTTSSRQSRDALVESARRAAFARTATARMQVVGVTAPGPSAALDSSVEARITARQLAERMFSWDNPNMEQVAEILGSMITRLGPGMQWTAETVSGGHCQGRAAYVMGHRPPIHLCPAFFASSTEQQVRTLIHESAHLAGIGQPDGESYCAVFDCQTNCGGFESADSWAQYVHCLSHQRPDSPTAITAPRHVDRGRQK
jgi:Lysine-specific metallo-endopeptidase